MRLLRKEFYLTQNQAGQDLHQAVQRVGEEAITQRGLQIAWETDIEEFSRTSCLPTTFAMAINLIKQQRTFGLEKEDAIWNVGHILEVALLTHSNNKVSEAGEIFERGYPSLDRRTGNFYHAFLLGFAQRFDLKGILIADLLNSAKLANLVQAGAVVLVSVDNLFIPEVSGKNRGIFKLRVGRHVILVHDVWEIDNRVKVLYSDVFNPPIEDDFVPINLRIESKNLDKYLWTERMPHITPRMIALWEENTQLHPLVFEELSDNISELRINPQLLKWPRASFGQYLERLKYAHRGCHEINSPED